MRAEPRPVSLMAGSFRMGAVFAVTVAVMTLQPLAAMTYEYLYDQPGGQMIQELPPQGLPIPRSLMWSDGVREFVFDLAPITASTALFVQIGLACVLVYALLRALNPTFRVTTGVDWNQALLSRTYMHTAPLIKAFLITVTASPAAALAWYMLERWTGGTPAALTVRMALLGAAGWFLLSRDGVAADYDSGNYGLPRSRRTVASLLVRGALAGAVGAAVSIAASHAGADQYFRMYRSMGAIGQRQWWSIIGLALTPAVGLGFASGGLLASLAVPSRPARERVRACLAPAGILVLTAWWTFLLVPGRAARLHDFLPNDHRPPEMRLATIAGISAGDPPVTRFVLIAPDREVRQLAFRPVSITGLRADADAATRLREYLRSRHWRSALSDPAIRTLHDAASASWEPEQGLEIDQLCLDRCPDFPYINLYAEALMTTAATDAARRHADALSDTSRFAFLDRDSRALMGDVFARLGERDKALAWYARAGIPATRASRRLDLRGTVSDGSVQGRVRLDGRPLAGMRVAIAPAESVRDMGSAFAAPGEVRPFWLRHISASCRTAPDGSYQLAGLSARPYILMVELPGDAKLAPGRTVSAAGAPGSIMPTAAQRALDLGTIALTTHGDRTVQTR